MLIVVIVWFTSQPAVEKPPVQQGYTEISEQSTTGQARNSMPIDLRVVKQEFTDLFYQNRTLASLAQPDQYTVVEVYLDSCGVCKRLENNFPAFLAARHDVTIQRVRFPEYGFTPNIREANSTDPVQAREQLDKRIKSYNMCGTPHMRSTVLI